MKNFNGVISEIIITIAIMCTYSWFPIKLLDYVTGINEIEKMCPPDPFIITNSSYFCEEEETQEMKQKRKQKFEEDAKKREECEKNKEIALKKIDLSRHLAFIVIGVSSIIVSGFLPTPATQLGVGFSGLVIIFIAMTQYCRKYGELAKLVVLGLSSVIFLYASVTLYGLGDLSTFFNWNTVRG